MLQKITTNKKYLLGITLLITAIVYLPTLFFQYVYLDDFLMVQEPGFHNNLMNIPGSFFRSLWAYSATAYQYYRPVSISLYILGTWISQQISGETLPWIYHLTNWLLQLAVVGLFFKMLLKFGFPLISAMTAALLFAVHPAMAGTIGWIPGQNEMLLTIFILTSMITLRNYFEDPKNSWLFWHGFTYLLALLTKENAIILPVLGILCALSANKFGQHWKKLLVLWIATLGMWTFMLKAGASQPNPVTANVLASILGVAHYTLVYLGKIFFPFSLSTLPTFKDTSVVILISGAFAIGLMGAAVFFSRQRWFTLMGIAWYFGFLLPTFAMASVQDDGSFILREDRGYLASIGLWLALLPLAENLFARWQIGLKTKMALGMIALLIFSALNLLHQQNYSNGKAFYAHAAENSPNLAFAHTHLADMHLTEKNFDLAIKGYEKALQLNPLEPQAHNNLGVTYLRSGKSEQAAEHFRAELKFNPNNILSLYNLGAIYFHQNRLVEAEHLFRQAVKLNPVYTDGWKGLVGVYTMLKETQKLEEAKRGLAQSEWDMSKGL